MPTPHNTASKEQIAKKVLMPGDPLRAKFIAEEYLEEVTQVNQVRNMLAYTGKYKGKEVTVMGSGMGMPSIGIYSYELFQFYDVDAIIRVGSAISYSREIGLFDVVIGSGACSESSFAFKQGGFEGDFIVPDTGLVQGLKQSAKKLGIQAYEGVIHSSDVFYYQPGCGANDTLFQKYPVACGEMESFALFHNAAVTGKQAATILTISDTAFSKEEVPPEGRQNGFHNMMKIALETI
ncbi:purine-nucleoside phosphorylase [Lachnospiraceae bacterium 29-91]